MAVVGEPGVGKSRRCWIGPNRTAILCRWMLGRSLAQRREFSEAIALAGEAVAIAGSVTGRDSLVLASAEAGEVHLLRNRETSGRA